MRQRCAKTWSWSSYTASKYFWKHFNNVTVNVLFRSLFFSITRIMWECVCRDNVQYSNYCKDEPSKSWKAMNLQSLHPCYISHSFLFYEMQTSIKLKIEENWAEFEVVCLEWLLTPRSWIVSKTLSGAFCRVSIDSQLRFRNAWTPKFIQSQ